MGLRKAGMRTVALKEWEQGRTEDETGYAQVYSLAQANIYPLTGSTAALLYGERVKKMRLMLVPPETMLHERMGVCVDAPPESPPDYRITGAIEVYRTHVRAHLERIREAEEADGGGPDAV